MNIERSMQLLAKITTDRCNLVADIRDYCLSFDEFWRQVPSLALEADGRTGYCEGYEKAYRERMWTVLEDTASFVAVDLETGTLVNYFAWVEASKRAKVAAAGLPVARVTGPLASEASILKLATNVDKLNGQKVVSDLQAAAARPYWQGYSSVQIEAWRYNLRSELGL